MSVSLAPDPLGHVARTKFSKAVGDLLAIVGPQRAADLLILQAEAIELFYDLRAQAEVSE